LLWQHKERSVKSIGDQLWPDSGILTQLLKRMEDAGLVTRLRSRLDERIVLVQLTTGKLLQKKVRGIPGNIFYHLRLRDTQLTSLKERIV